MFQLTPIVKKILIINAAILAIEMIFRMSLAPLFGVHSILSDDFFIFQYATYMWLHADVFHLLFNMIAVLVFGPMLERVWGSKRFLMYYLVTGIGAGVLYGAIDAVEKLDIKSDTEAFLADPNPENFNKYIFEHGRVKTRNGKQFILTNLGEFSDEYFENEHDSRNRDQAISAVKKIKHLKSNSGLMIGASGAVFGILIAFGMLFPNTELMLLFPPIPIKAKYLVFGYGAYALYNVINSTAGDDVAHLAHLTGMLTGFIMLKIWQKQRGNFY